MKTIQDVHAQFASFFSDERIRPYAYFLSLKLSEGHICILPHDVHENKSILPFSQISDPSVLSQISDFVSSDAAVLKPFILYRDKLYLQRYFSYESKILSSIHNMLAHEKQTEPVRKEDLLNIAAVVKNLGYSEADPLSLPEDLRADWQLAAAISGFLNHFTIITGGPGTGKTTTVAKILTILLEHNIHTKIALAATTGKAAMRMGESLKSTTVEISDAALHQIEQLKPTTIHRLLGFVPNSIYFKHDENNPLPYDVIIVDEASMLDVALFSKLLSAIGPHTRLILLGDKNQLASVEAGSLFGDLCSIPQTSGMFSNDRLQWINDFIKEDYVIPASAVTNHNNPLGGHIIELKRSRRFHAQSAIGHFSRAIIENNQTQLDFFIRQNKDTSVVIDINRDALLFEQIILQYRDFIEEPDKLEALKKLNHLRVLCAVREGEMGIYAVNKKIEQVLKKNKIINAGTKDFFSPQDGLYENRPVMITQNNNDLELFNGDIGIVRADDAGVFKIWFEGNNNQVRKIEPSFIPEMETVFAMTIHKSQGSEYKTVLTILPDNKDNHLLTRELLYTAVTRASEKVVIQAEEDILWKTTEAQVKRISGIIDRITELSIP